MMTVLSVRKQLPVGHLWGQDEDEDTERVNCKTRVSGSRTRNTHVAKYE